MKSNKRFLKTFLFSAVIVLINTFGAAGLGLIEVHYLIGAAIAGVGLFWFICCIIYNCAYRARKVKELTSTTAQGLYDQITKRMDEVRADVEKERKKVERLLRLALLYNISLLIAAFMINVGVCLMMNYSMLLDTEVLAVGERLLLMAVLVAYLYLLFGFIPAGTLIQAGNAHANERERAYELEKKDYPLLYSLATRAAQSVGYDRPFILCRALDDVDISVSEYGGTVAIFLPPTEVSLLTEGELYSVLLHEFAHAKNRDTDWLNDFNNAKTKYSAEGKGKIVTFIKNLLFWAVADKVDVTADDYRMCASLLIEQRADAAVKEHGDPQAFINASAKGLMAMQFFGGFLPELYYCFYDSEQPVEDTFARKRALFEQRLPSIYGHRREVVLRTLEGKRDSHPTLRMRMKACGIEDFDVFMRPEGEYLEEVMRYLDDCGKICATFGGWEEARKEYFLDVQERIKAFEQKLEEGVSPDRYETWNALYDYRRAAPEKALALADKLLEECPEDLHANAVKGAILCSEDRDGGIELIRKAIDAAGAQMAYYLIDIYGNAVLRSGDEELLKKLRAEQTAMAQRIMDGLVSRLKDKRPSPKQIIPCDLPESEIAELKEVLKNHGGEIENVYAAKYVRGKLSAYIVAFNPVNPRAEQRDNAFFEYLNMLERADRYFIPYYGLDKLTAAVRDRGVKLK